VDVDTRYVAFSTGAIIEAACTLESAINELRSDMEIPTDRTLGKTVLEVPTMRRLWQTVDRLNPLDKVQWILLLGRCEPFDQGSDPFQAASDVMAIRNELVHFKAQWTEDAQVSQRLEQRLSGKFPVSGWAAPSQLFFPYRCVGAGAANWAWRSVRSLLIDFYQRLGTVWPLANLNPQIEAAFGLGAEERQ